MRLQLMTILAIAGLITAPACGAWPSFGGEQSESISPAGVPAYTPPGTQPETSTQKWTRTLNPVNWLPTSEKKPPPPDPISLATPTGPITPQLRVAMAQMTEAQGNVEQARAIMNQALVESPHDPLVLREFARMEDRAGRLAEAEQLYGRAMALNPKDSAARNDLGLCLARAGKLKESAHVLRTAVELKPDKALYRNNLATVLVELGDAQGAFMQLSAVHQPAAAHFNLGQLYMQRGRQAEAAVCFQNALQVDPTMQPAQAALARIYQPNAVQVASRPAVPQAPAPADTSPVIPETADSQPIGPAFPVPRNLPSVE